MDFPLLFDVVSKVHRSEGKILLFVYVEHSKIKLDNLRNFFMLIYSFLSNKAPTKKIICFDFEKQNRAMHSMCLGCWYLRWRLEQTLTESQFTFQFKYVGDTWNMRSFYLRYRVFLRLTVLFIFWIWPASKKSMPTPVII